MTAALAVLLAPAWATSAGGWAVGVAAHLAYERVRTVLG